MSRIERITRTSRGPESVLRAQRALAVPRVGPRPDREPDEREPRDERPRRPAEPDGPHLDVRA